MEEPKAASRLLAGLCFWLIPFGGGACYAAVASFTRPAQGHGFEYGFEGFVFASEILLVLTLVNTLGFLLAISAMRSIASRDSRRLYCLSAFAGIASIPAIQLVALASPGGGNPPFAFWVSFLLTTAITTSAVLSLLILHGAVIVGFIHYAAAPRYQEAGGVRMGSSFTEYRGNGFWTLDGKIELWLYLLEQEARKIDNAPEWLRAAAEDWHIQATAGMGGCVSAGLDEYALTPERVEVILQLAERALAGLRARGDVLPLTWLNSLGLGGPGSYFTGDVPTEAFTPVGETFIRLLRGEVTWDASTSPLV